MDAIVETVLQDARTLTAAGVHALMLENFGDAPFFPGRVPRHTVAAMTRLACEVRRESDLPLGINVLRNDGGSALAVAAAAGAEFIRVNVLCGARVTDQGVIQGIAHRLLRGRRVLDCGRISILADVDVKHSAALAHRPIGDEIADVIQRGGADGIIVSGSATGSTVDVDELRTAMEAAGTAPVLIGSGVSLDNVGQLVPHADGLIVGTSLKVDGISTNPVDEARAAALMRTYEASLSSGRPSG
jgi:membrane complex biogenesis BtpA family protein